MRPNPLMATLVMLSFLPSAVGLDKVGPDQIVMFVAPGRLRPEEPGRSTRMRLGFRECARVRQARLWEGVRYDSVQMDLLREEWRGLPQP